MNRTWSVTFPKFGTVSVLAFDEMEAAHRILTKLDLTPQPCCYLEETPCPGCEEQARLDAQERAEEIALEQARKG